MEIKKIIRNSMLVLATAAVTISCSEDFLDVNDNPNNPSESTPGLTLTVAQQHFTTLNAEDMNYLGNYIVYNWATPSNWSANQEFFRYTVNNTFYSQIFEESYADTFKNLNYVKDIEDPSGAADYGNYDAIVETIKGFQYQHLVDLYGDIPYTEANLRGANTTPKYDDAETIYKSVIDSLTSAAILALNPADNAEDPGSADIIFGGDMTKWAQFANTIKLRMLIRLSNTGQDSYIQTQIGLIDANGAGYVTEDVSANPGYSANEDQQSPFYGFAGYNEAGEETDRHDYTVATDFLVASLQDNNDPRIDLLFDLPANGDEHKGVKQAIALPGTGFTANDLSKIGEGLLKSPEQDQPIMLLAEALFLESEATVRGYIAGGDAAAKELYNDGIQASFDYLGAEGAEDYYTQSKENVSWDASSNKIEAIITQKYFALNGVSGIESWIELTRTGFPSGLPIPEDSDGKRPVRLLYPSSEYARNSDNVPATTTADAFNNPPFWK
jgi:hypothetical protein